jgi:hypothetical protein
MAGRNASALRVFRRSSRWHTNYARVPKDDQARCCSVTTPDFVPSSETLEATSGSRGTTNHGSPITSHRCSWPAATMTIVVLPLTFQFSPSPARLLLGINRKRRGLSWLVRRLLLLFGSAFSRGRGTFLGTQSGNPLSVSRFPALSLVRS